MWLITDFSYQCLNDTDWAATDQKHHTVAYKADIQVADFDGLFHWPIGCFASKTEGLKQREIHRNSALKCHVYFQNEQWQPMLWNYLVMWL